MKRLRYLWHTCGRRLDRIWEEQERDQGAEPAREPAPARLRAFLRANRRELLYVSAMGVLLFVLSWILPFNEAPDESMRYLIPTYIYRHGTIPAGWDPEVRSKLWGFSYAFHPILPYIFGGWLMRLVGLFHASEKALLMAARFVNILTGAGFYWYVLRISKRLFRNRLFGTFFVALLSMLPQLLYLFVYVNTDALAVFSSALLIDAWLRGLDRRWDRGACTRLAVGVSVCALSYFNAYGYALFSVVIFAGSLAVFYAPRGFRYCVATILKRGIYITVLVAVLAGWWFVRSAVLYDGDILGMEAADRCAEQYAQPEFKPSAMRSVAEQGTPLEVMLRTGDGGMEWIRLTYRSTIGVFGYMKYYLGLDIYEIHKRLFELGMIGLALLLAIRALSAAGRAMPRFLRRAGHAGGAEGKPPRRLPGPDDAFRDETSGAWKLHPANFCLLQFSLVCSIIIPIALSIYYSYRNDFQAQGRYIMPMVIPMAYFITVGIQSCLTLVFRKWMTYVLMVPLFYAVLHVFLAAFVSVYVPTFVEGLAAWSQIRFPWFVNIALLGRLPSLLIPG